MEAHPFLKMLLPLVIGIIIADKGEETLPLPAIVFYGTIGLSLTAMTGCLWLKGWRRRHWFGGFSFLFFLLLGFMLCKLKWEATAPSYPTYACIYEGYLTDSPDEKRRSRLCPVALTGRWEETHRIPTTGNILLYLPKDSLTDGLKPGDRLFFHGTITPPQPSGIPTGFDYPRYLRHHQVNGTLYTTRWRQQETPHKSLKTKPLSIREHILDYYRKTGLQGERFAVLSALTLGYKQELDSETQARFSASGAGHVLALSGLHIGILCMVLHCFYGILLRGGRHRRLRRLLVIPAVWAFVFLVGLPLSAIRAAWMFTLLAVGSLFTRVGYPLNTLALTAFGMLVYNPFFLFDVGFQLSFLAVASLLLLQPKFEQLLPPIQHPVLNYLWQITTVSVAAQIGVIPLSLYYFSQLPLYSLLVNLWLIPLTWLIVALAVPFILASFFPVGTLQIAGANLLSFLLDMMNNLLETFNRLPGSSVNDIVLQEAEVIVIYLALIVGCYSWAKKWLRGWTATLAILICGTCRSIYRHETALQQHILQIGNLHGVPTLRHIHGTSITDFTPDTLLQQPGSTSCITQVENLRICQLHDNRWEKLTASKRLPLDYLYVSKGFTGELRPMLNLFSINCIVLDTSLSKYRREQYLKECKELEIKCINLEKSRYLEIKL